MDIDLAAAIKQVAAGQRVIAPGLLSSTPEPDPDDGKLTNREKQILQLIAEGKSNKEIAALLELSVNTVSVHRANLMEALGIHRTAELVLYAVRKGLVHIP
jgi:DNA-binding NarL/FixJ family response regulator